MTQAGPNPYPVLSLPSALSPGLVGSSQLAPLEPENTGPWLPKCGPLKLWNPRKNGLMGNATETLGPQSHPFALTLSPICLLKKALEAMETQGTPLSCWGQGGAQQVQ